MAIFKIYLSKPVLLLLVFAIGICFSFVQKNIQDEDKIKTIIESKHYIFKAESVAPARGASRQLSDVYDLSINKDTLVSSLPFFGRAYTAPMKTDDTSIKFTSINFLYYIKKTRKNGWQVEILPKDTRNVRQLFLNLSADGRGSLIVISNDRERISFNGYITEITSGK